MSGLVDNCQAILDMLRRLNRPVAQKLREGIEPHSLSRSLARFGLEAPMQLSELYGWRDGTAISDTDTIGEIAFIPGYHFLSMERGLLHYASLLDSPYWNATWLPILTNGGGDFFVVDLAKRDHFSAPIIVFRLGEEIQEQEYDSIALMIETIRRSFYENAYYVNEAGFLDEDAQKHRRIAAEINPQSPAWRRSV